MRLVIVACSLGAGVASADIAPPRASGSWVLDDELHTRDVPREPERKEARHKTPLPERVVVESRLQAPATQKREREPSGDILEFVDDTIDAGELADRVGGRTVVKRVVPPPRKARKR
jgi:hypothetical protein